MSEQITRSGAPGERSGSGVTRKKDTGEPGNGGEFGTTQREASGITLDSGTQPGWDPGLAEEVQHALDMLTDNSGFDHARHDEDGMENRGYPQAEHAAAVQALRTYAEALRGEKRHGFDSAPFLIQPYLQTDTDPLPAYPDGLPEPSV